MIAVIQRVNDASVEVDGIGVTGEIERGLCVLACVVDGDHASDIEWMAGKLARLRIFPNDQGRFDLSVQDVGGEILLVSQFTLAGDCRKGNRPSFIRAADPEHAEPMLERLAELLRDQFGLTVATGRFGGSMKVRLENDGPVTLVVHSPRHDADE
jgi:D-tyrosyl-tRNA(Tyr) deacylase